MNLMNSGMWGIGFALVDMRRESCFKRFVARHAAIGFPDGAGQQPSDPDGDRSRLAAQFWVLIFHMRVLGSFSASCSSAGWARLIWRTRAAHRQPGAQDRERERPHNIVMMPMWIFSGVFFSYERFPALVQPFIKALPLTALNDALRATILEGASLPSQAGRIAYSRCGAGSRLSSRCAGSVGLNHKSPGNDVLQLHLTRLEVLDSPCDGVESEVAPVCIAEHKDLLATGRRAAMLVSALGYFFPLHRTLELRDESC